jgi:hypothetical protein
VDVVVGATDGVYGAIECAARGGQVFEEFRFDFGVDPWLAMFGAKYNMKQDV